MPIHIHSAIWYARPPLQGEELGGILVNEELSLSRKPKQYLNYVDHGVSPEISYDCSTGQITINGSDNCIDLSVIGYTPPKPKIEEAKKEYIYGRYLQAVTDYKTMTIISKNKEGNRAKSGSKTYTYNKHNWNNWKQATQQEQS